MSGRDCIGIAKTGSGKTLAFVLPLLRHIRDQSELRDGDGPIGLIMAPTRELVQQIAKVGVWMGVEGCGWVCRGVSSGGFPWTHRLADIIVLRPDPPLLRRCLPPGVGCGYVLQEVRKLGGPVLISCTPVFGGTGVGHQISELKRGTEVRSMAGGGESSCGSSRRQGLEWLSSTQNPACVLHSYCRLWPPRPGA